MSGTSIIAQISIPLRESLNDRFILKSREPTKFENSGMGFIESVHER